MSETITRPETVLTDEQHILLWEQEQNKYLQLRNEVASEFVEGMRESFVTKFTFPVVNGEVISVGGEAWRSIVHKDYEQARQDAARRPEHAFYVERSRADVKLAERVNRMMRSDEVNTIVTFSPFPEDVYREHPHAVKQRNYRPDVRRSMVWVHRKLHDGAVELSTITLDGLSFSELQQLHKQFGGRTVQSSEDMPHAPVERNLSREGQNQLIQSLANYAGVEQGHNAIERAEEIGGELIEYVAHSKVKIEQASDFSDLSQDLQEAISHVLEQDNLERVLPGIVKDLEIKGIGGELSSNQKSALMRCITYSGWAAFKQRIDNNSNYQHQTVGREVGGAGSDFIATQQMMLGCAGDLNGEFSNVFEAIFGGDIMSDYGRSTGAGECVKCNEYKSDRGGCKVCKSCHISIKFKM